MPRLRIGGPTFVPGQLAASTPLSLAQANGISTFSLDIVALRTTLDAIYAQTPIDASNLPTPTTTTLGGVKALASTTSKWLNSVSTLGIFSATQPAFTDISGNIAISQMNSGTSASNTTFWRGDGVWAAPAGGGGGGALFVQGRLTLSTGVAITTSDVTGATSVYFALSGGNQVPIYDGSITNSTTFTELTLPLDSNSGHTNYHQAAKNYDLFVINDGGTIRLGTGPKWDDGAGAGSDTARGTGANSTELELKNGWLTNKNTITIRFGSSSGNTVSVAANRATYVGSIRCTANGQTEDSKTKRFLYNAYNQVRRSLLRADATATWNYSTATVRQANGSTSNQVEYLAGLTGSTLNLTLTAIVINDNATLRVVVAGIGIDSTTVSTATTQSTLRAADAATAVYFTAQAWYEGSTQLGYHFCAMLEKGNGAGTQTWIGTSGDNTAGIHGGIFQ